MGTVSTAAEITALQGAHAAALENLAAAENARDDLSQLLAALRAR